MAHQKVYGICEDKCRVEVYPKTAIRSVTLSGTFTKAAATYVCFNIPDITENDIILAEKFIFNDYQNWLIDGTNRMYYIAEIAVADNFRFVDDNGKKCNVRVNVNVDADYSDPIDLSKLTIYYLKV